MEYPNATYGDRSDEEIVKERLQYLDSKLGQGDGTHERVPPEKEREHLSELKTLASEHAREQKGITKGSTAAIAQSALGKYASAMGTEIGVPGVNVQGSTNFADHPVDEEKLLHELKEEAKHRERYEDITQGTIDRSPAAQVQSSADKLEKVIKQYKEFF
ncbi:hypothetical protein C1645_750721 [Glomus cerebriforme]|uniref:Uncharacterized protein n=1 Tax=Glomus cerebriforme TaxID=658196 RepID=A0A397TIU2_9GLOM|nr:hypothetical protein C1645_750721 [Glomus cerebriforme]